MNVPVLGYGQVLLNSAGIVLLFLLLGLVFTGIAKMTGK